MVLEMLLFDFNYMSNFFYYYSNKKINSLYIKDYFMAKNGFVVNATLKLLLLPRKHENIPKV